MTSLVTALGENLSVSPSPFPFCEMSWDAQREPILPTDVIALFVQIDKGGNVLAASSATRIRDPWITFEHTRTTTNGQAGHHLLISNLSWSSEEAADIRLRLLPFEEDWNAPGMDVYDAL